MKNIVLSLIILQLVSCVSTKNVAKIRNSDFRAHNNFEFFKIWGEIDIVRFNTEKLNIKIALIPEDKLINEFENDSQLITIYDSLKVMIDDKMAGFQDLRKMYFDTTEEGKSKIYEKLKSDSSDNAFLDKIAESPYFELYDNIIKRQRSSIQKSSFYTSQKNFENYLQNRSIQVVDMNLTKEIFGQDTLSINKLSKSHIDSFRKNQIDFLIAFSGSYNVAYSDRAQSRVGSEHIKLIVFDVHSADRISTAQITHFWGSE
jgi:hypothetical protein